MFKVVIGITATNRSHDRNFVLIFGLPMTFKKKIEFSLVDYLRMYQKHGWRLPYAYFFENHLFDIIHGTNTHVWLPNELVLTRPRSYKYGVFYMASWTSVIKLTTLKALDYCPYPPSLFIDIGCGKGKVLCVWEIMFKNSKAYKFLGIDYNHTLIEICRENLIKIKASKSNTLVQDGKTISLSSGDEITIVYMFNPFNAQIMKHFLTRIKNNDVILIYNNPVLDHLVISAQFYLLERQLTWHPSNDFCIYASKSLQKKLLKGQNPPL